VRELIPWFSGTYRIKLKDGMEIPIARRRAKKVRKMFGD
jgi:DNA-binding LytR/AlgR family response regulator